MHSHLNECYIDIRQNNWKQFPKNVEPNIKKLMYSEECYDVLLSEYARSQAESKVFDATLKQVRTKKEIGRKAK